MLLNFRRIYDIGSSSMKMTSYKKLAEVVILIKAGRQLDKEILLQKWRHVPRTNNDRKLVNV